MRPAQISSGPPVPYLGVTFTGIECARVFDEAGLP
jgi:hypothetical protein